MKNTPFKPWRSRLAFTLIELLVVIAIIAILAAMLLPAIMGARNHAYIAQAKIEMKGIVTAVNQYEADYSRLPAPSTIDQGLWSVTGTTDITFGLTGYTVQSNVATNNSDIMAILADINWGGNTNYSKNPQQKSYIEPKVVNATTGVPGFSTIDHQYRDPWGQPYIITLDLNNDGKCEDAIYKLQAVSYAGNGGTGYNGLVDTVDTSFASGADNFALSGSVMVWSYGPDQAYLPITNAISPPFKDNVLGWQ